MHNKIMNSISAFNQLHRHLIKVVMQMHVDVRRNRDMRGLSVVEGLSCIHRIIYRYSFVSYLWRIDAIYFPLTATTIRSMIAEIK